ncbi:MAG: PH domain-containing protein [Clostridia bacterium]|nr:PH domain-containing protein [Clostridia bacterium]
MKHKYHPHWTQPLQNLRILLLLPAAELLHRHTAVGLLCVLLLIQYLSELHLAPDVICFRGLLYRMQVSAPARMDFSRSLPFRLLGGVPVRLYTAVHALPRHTFVLSVPAAHHLYRSLGPPLTDAEHRPSLWARLLSAAMQPHLAAGWALTVPFFRRLDSTRLTELLQRILPVANDLWLHLPAPWLLLTAAVVTGWAVAFLRRMEESARIRLLRGNDILAVQCGLLTRRTRIFFLRQCIGAELRQNPVLLLCGIAPVYLYTGQRHPAILLPALRECQLSAVPDTCGFTASAVFAPPASARGRFGRVELSLLALLLPLYGWAAARSAFLLQYAFAALGLMLCLRIWVQQCAFSRTAVRLSDTHLSVCRCKGLSVVTTTLPRTGISAAAVRAHWFQRRAGLCTLVLHAPGLPVLKVKHLNLRDGLRIQRMLTGIK